MSEQIEAPAESVFDGAQNVNRAGLPTATGAATVSATATGTGAEINLDALMDVQVVLSVEIGRTKVPIKQLVSLNQGSVIELDRGVNEPLDLLVNGTLMARGEVVVVDGQFGLRLIDIVSPSERLKKLK
jgi:flagellar motor switch protein FliN/FliY